QIYLETEMFNSGFRPAVNPGLSVSRVGGAAQIKAMKKIAAPIRVELAQYRELAAFSQFGSELDDDTKEKLAQGERIRQILVQPQYKPLPVEKQTVIIYAAVKHYLLDIAVNQIAAFEEALFEYISNYEPDIFSRIREEKEIKEDVEKMLVHAIVETKKKMQSPSES
ncbi:MAG: F0F1 ATP synthase subunit alpha, partial [Eubacterium sp.]|nr:F0F1 ATP synthase subunit alpha [Eubacterium sp.]